MSACVIFILRGISLDSRYSYTLTFKYDYILLSY